MEHDDLQLENGNYTRIVNKVLDELVKLPLPAAELRVCIYVIRKTWGYQKKEDGIPLTQFQTGTGLCRKTVVKALKNLQLVDILKLVKKGNSVTSCNIYRFNKYYSHWKLVDTRRLVQDRTLTGVKKLKKLVDTRIHSKDNIKRKQKKDSSGLLPLPTREVIKYFSGKYTEAVGGIYQVNWGKDGGLIKNLLATQGEERLKVLIDRFFASKDEFIERAGYTIGVFYGQINKLQSGGRQEKEDIMAKFGLKAR